MGYSVSFLVIYGVEVSDDNLQRFVSPEDRATAVHRGYDMSDPDDILGYISTYGITDRIHEVHYKLVMMEDELYMCSFIHEHSANEPPKDMNLPSADENKAFTCWCESNGIVESPKFMTLANVSY